MKEIKFGEYIQNHQTSGPIEWVVLEEKEDKCMLTTKYGIDAQVYHTSDEGITWEQSYIRSWLNKEFYDKAFSDIDKKYIIDTLSDGICTDRVFLLSDEEAKKYFSSINANKIIATPYAMSKGLEIGFDDYVSYWLREPGHFISDIWGTKGSVMYGTNGYMLSVKLAVRPTIWVIF